MATTHAIPIRQALRKLFPSRWLRQTARATGMMRRHRKIDPVAFFWCLVLGAGGGRARSLAGLRRSYERTTGQQVEESSFYDRFNVGLVAFLKRAVAEALQSSLGVERALRGPLAAFRDVLLTDATVIRLHAMLAKTYPACRTNHTKAALKAHVILSVVGSGRQSVKVTSERAHDGPKLRVGPWVRDRLFLFDLAYFRYQLFSCITRNGGYFLSRLKGNADPRIVAVNRTYRGRSIPLVGEKLRDVASRLKREVLDVTVEVEFRRRRYAGLATADRQLLRVVGVRNDDTNEHHFYITNVPPGRLTAEDVQAIYALRWEIEMVFKELKQNYRIDDIPSRRKAVVDALLYASILTLVVSRRLLALARKALKVDDYRLPTRRWAAILEAVMADLLSIALRPPRENSDLARRISNTVMHEAIDPNRKRRRLLHAVETRSHRYRERPSTGPSRGKIAA